MVHYHVYIAIGEVHSQYANDCWGIRPVVVMNEGVYIAGGDGTEANPYVLGKN